MRNASFLLLSEIELKNDSSYQVQTSIVHLFWTLYHSLGFRHENIWKEKIVQEKPIQKIIPARDIADAIIYFSKKKYVGRYDLVG